MGRRGKPERRSGARGYSDKGVEHGIQRRNYIYPGYLAAGPVALKHETAILVRPFLAGEGKEGVGLKCPGCGLVYVPPKPFCSCLSVPDQWVEVKDTGVVTTFTFSRVVVVRRHAGGRWDTDDHRRHSDRDGSDTEEHALLQDVERDEVDVGMRVRVKWPDKTSGTLDDIEHSQPE